MGTSQADVALNALDLTGQTKIEILRAFGYEVVPFGACFKSYIIDNEQAFTVIADSEIEAIEEAYKFLQDEVDPDFGYVFPV